MTYALTLAGVVIPATLVAAAIAVIGSIGQAIRDHRASNKENP